MDAKVNTDATAVKQKFPTEQSTQCGQRSPNVRSLFNRKRLAYDAHMTTESQVLTFELRHRLARSLEVSGVTKEEMAAAIGRTVRTIDNYLAGRTIPVRGYLVVWSNTTGIPMSELVGDLAHMEPRIRRELEDQLALFLDNAA